MVLTYYIIRFLERYYIEMRLRLKFELDNPCLLVDYRRTFISFIKYCLTEAGEKYYNDNYGNTDKKDWTFSVFLNNAKLDGDKFLLESKHISMDMSFENEMKGYLFFAIFSKQLHKIFPIYNNKLKLIKVLKTKEETQFYECMMFKTMSPILLLSHLPEENIKDSYLSYDNPEFSILFEKLTGVKFIPIDCKKTVIKHFGLNFQATLGTFILAGKPELIKKLYLNGIGNRTGEGFGMVTVV